MLSKVSGIFMDTFEKAVTILEMWDFFSSVMLLGLCARDTFSRHAAVRIIFQQNG